MNILNIDRITALSGIIPFIKNYSNSVFVIKYGGSAMQDLSSMYHVIEDILFLYYIGIKVVLVHGGGPSINSWLKKVNIEAKFHNGLRLTDKKTMEIVQMVLCGNVNKNLVSMFNSYSSVAVGISGQDSNMIQSQPMFNISDNYVGKINKINNQIINILLNNGYIPIIASIGIDTNGQSYNINADIVAGELAASLKANKLLLLTDASGIMRDLNDSSTLLKLLTTEDLLNLKDDNIIADGMIPKANSCINALKKGVKSAHIIDGRFKHSLLYEIFTEDRLGSMIVS
uniref:Acetylglutamate kinase n=1 Tax=Pleonosporium borreri TaxID=2575635 RepID=A0A4D6WZ32_9FLOR|nr:acetylglutamate kinase [Pleonosporium borreri]